MEELVLNQNTIECIKIEAIQSVKKLMGNDLKEIILYGSCARGDFTADSDIDIALITAGDRMSIKKYDDGLAAIATELAMRYFAIVNFVCLPEAEYLEKKTWYAYFKNIAKGGRNSVWIRNILMRLLK